MGLLTYTQFCPPPDYGGRVTPPSFNPCLRGRRPGCGPFRTGKPAGGGRRISFGFSDYLETLEKRLVGVGYVILAGRGASLAAAGTRGLIIKEAAHFPAEGMSCAAFRHGPLDMASPQTFVLVYEGLDPTRALNRNLVADIRKIGGCGARGGCSRQGCLPSPGHPVQRVGHPGDIASSDPVCGAGTTP